MPLFPHHSFTWGSSGEAVAGVVGGGAYYLRRKRWMVAFCFLVLVLC